MELCQKLRLEEPTEAVLLQMKMILEGGGRAETQGNGFIYTSDIQGNAFIRLTECVCCDIYVSSKMIDKAKTRNYITSMNDDKLGDHTIGQGGSSSSFAIIMSLCPIGQENMH